MTTTNVTIQVPEQNQLLSEAAAAHNTASLIIIQNESDLQFATEQMNGMSKRVKELDTLRKSITAPLDQAKKNVMALFKPVTESYQTAIGQIKKEIGGYIAQKEREAEEARRKAELEAEAERKALEAKAKEAETPEQAEALQQAAATVTAAPVVKVEKTKGMSTTKVWKAEVKDAPAFLVHVATHPELLNCIEINVHAIERFVTATGGTVTLPGIELSQEIRVTSRG